MLSVVAIGLNGQTVHELFLGQPPGGSILLLIYSCLASLAWSCLFTTVILNSWQKTVCLVGVLDPRD